VFNNQTFDFVDLAGVKSIIGSQLYWIKPEFGLISSGAHMDMRLFPPFVAEKEKPIPTDSLGNWHCLLLFVN